MLVNEDPVDPFAIEDSESEQASKLADNIIPMKLIPWMNYSHATDPSATTIRARTTTQRILRNFEFACLALAVLQR
jgi:hypothetical protein